MVTPLSEIESPKDLDIDSNPVVLAQAERMPWGADSVGWRIADHPLRTPERVSPDKKLLGRQLSFEGLKPFEPGRDGDRCGPHEHHALFDAASLSLQADGVCTSVLVFVLLDLLGRAGG